MILKIRGIIPEDVDLYVRVIDNEVILNRDNSSEIFNIEKIGEYKIYFYNKKDSSDNLILRFLFFLLSLVGFVLYPEYKWWNRINPYLLKAELITNISNDSEIWIQYSKSNYNKLDSTWTVPDFKTDSDGELTVEHLPNPYDFRRQLLYYLRKIASINIVVLIFSFIMLQSGINTNNIPLIYVSGTLMLSLLLIFFIVALIEYKRMKKLYMSFLKEIKMDNLL